MEEGKRRVVALLGLEHQPLLGRCSGPDDISYLPKKKLY